MEFFVLPEGTFAIDKNKNFTPFNPELQQKSDFKGSVFLDVQPFLVKTNHDIILLDTGVGKLNTNGNLQLIENLKQLGIAPNQVTKVLLSHLHKDHVGGLVNNSENGYGLNFPNATHYISKPEWDWVFELNSINYNYDAFVFLEKSGQLNFFEGSGQINNEISYEITGGHTPFHTAFHITEGKEHIFFGGDILTMPQQIGSTLLVKSDKFPREANAIRSIIVERAATEQWTCLFYHGFKTKYGTIVNQNDVYNVVNL